MFHVEFPFDISVRNVTPINDITLLFFKQCNIDLKRNVLRIGTTGTETPFLPESELPECARLSGYSEDEIVNQSIRDHEERQVKEAMAKSKQGGRGKKK